VALARRRPLLLELARASHPGPVVAVTGVSVAYAAVVGRGAAGMAAVGTAVLAGQLSIGWHNDFLDAERDAVARRPDKPVAVGAVRRPVVGAAALAALAATVPLSLASGWRAGAVHLAAVASAWAYNARLKATPLSFAPFALSFGLLPCFVVLGLPASPLPPWWAVGAASLLGVGAHLANVLPDLDDDLALGVAGIGHRLGRRRSLGATALVLLGGASLLAFGRGSPGALELAGFAASAALTVATLRAARDGRSRLPFQLTLVIAVVDVGLLLAEGHAHLR
jgi:4-hydroxybenzoate polyprenyltransferase